jgi:uncharacterized membrane protein
MSQWKRIGNFKTVLVIFAVFLIGVLIGSISKGFSPFQ